MRQQLGYWCTAVCIVHYVLNWWIIAEQISLVNIAYNCHSLPSIIYTYTNDSSMQGSGFSLTPNPTLACLRVLDTIIVLCTRNIHGWKPPPPHPMGSYEVKMNCA